MWKEAARKPRGLLLLYSEDWMAYRIVADVCTRCSECIEECPMDAISLDGADMYIIDPDACTDCGSCADICPAGAITGS
jgi:NAD-dependent dihydropyrimidine dehydrogenase PreA subunit